jgi:hypothetical protein
VSLDPAIVQEMQMLPRRAKVARVVEILVVYVRMRWLLFRRGLPATVAALRGSEVTATDPDEQRLLKVRGVRFANGVVRTLRLLPTDGRCLMRSLVLLAMLARRGIATRLVIGVSPAPTFTAHAWIELDGQALLETDESKYQRLVEL